MFTKLVRIGRDAELRVTPNGTQLLNFPCVYDVGFGENKKAQWLDVVMFGKRAESLSQHFTKGKQIVIYADDLQVETFQKNDGTQGVKLKCKLVEFDFAGSNQNESNQQGGFQQQAPQQPQQGGFQQSPPAVQQMAQQKAMQSGGAPQAMVQQAPSMDFDDDIPFAPIGLQHKALLSCM